jgi:hypothetical protein
MMRYFLKLKSWELFLMLVLPTALTYLMQIKYSVNLIGSIVFFALIVVFSWLFSIGKWANQHLPKDQQKNLVLFTLGFIVPIIYTLLLLLIYLPTLSPDSRPQPPGWMFPLHMLSLAGIFYGIWFSARQYMALQRGHDADFLIFSSTFFLMWLFPLGIWIIQPGVNRLFDKLDNSKT